MQCACPSYFQKSLAQVMFDTEIDRLYMHSYVEEMLTRGSPERLVEKEYPCLKYCPVLVNKVLLWIHVFMYSCIHVLSYLYNCATARRVPLLMLQKVKDELECTQV